MKKHVQLTVAPVLTMRMSEPEQCMAICTYNDTLPCHGFNYNVVKKECLFLNETEYTQPNMTMRRMGMLLYRKYCEIEIFPLVILRNTIAMVKNGTSFNTSTSTEVLRRLVPVIEDVTNMSTRDAGLASDIFLNVVDKTELGNSSKQKVKEFLKTCGRLFDLLLLRTKSTEHDKKTDRILVVFDKLLQKLSQSEHSDGTVVDVRSEMTSFKVQTVTLHSQQDYTSAVNSYSARSQILISHSSQNASDRMHRTTLVTGAIGGIRDAITPRLVQRPTDNTSLMISGQIVSVIMEPYLNYSFDIQLDISTIDGDMASSRSRSCVFLRHDSYSLWDTDGCSLVKYNKTHTRCRCSHLTNFAVLMQVTQFKLAEIHVTSLEILTVIGCCISIAALSTTIAVLLWLRLRSERYILLLHLSVAVVLAQVVFLVGIDAVNVKTVCRLVAIMLHYLYLSVFTLMLAEGIHLFHKLHRAFDADDNLNMLLILGWGSPFIIVSLSVLSDGDGYSTEENCWLSTEGAIWAFVGPALTIIAINMAILIIIIRTFLGVTIVAKRTDIQKFKASLKATAVLLPLLGITWMFGVVAVNKSTVIFQYIFAILNSLQGLFIFLFHVVFNEDVKKACSKYKKNQVTGTDSLPQSPSVKKLPRKANLYSITTSM